MEITEPERLKRKTREPERKCEAASLEVTFDRHQFSAKGDRAGVLFALIARTHKTAIVGLVGVAALVIEWLLKR
jgi:hypothetical protein